MNNTIPDVQVLLSLYQEGKSVTEIAKLCGLDRKKLSLLLKKEGLVLRSHRDRAILMLNERFAAARAQKPLPNDKPVGPVYAPSAEDFRREYFTPQIAVRLHFDALLSVKEIAERVGISRTKVFADIVRGGRTPRSRKEGMAVRMSRLTPEERKANASAAHEATRGKPLPAEQVIAIQKSKAGRAASQEEQVVAECLKAAGVGGVEIAFLVDRFLVDVAIPKYKMAIEVDGGNWHTSARKAAQDIKKTAALHALGWRIFRIRTEERRLLNLDTLTKEVLSYLSVCG